MVYYQDYRRPKKKDYGKKFDFLGFTFKPRTVASKNGGSFVGYGIAISQKAQTRIVEGWKQLNLHRRSDLTIQGGANLINPQIRGLIKYYGKHKLRGLQRLMWRFEYRLAKWALKVRKL